MKNKVFFLAASILLAYASTSLPSQTSKSSEISAYSDVTQVWRTKEDNYILRTHIRNQAPGKNSLWDVKITKEDALKLIKAG